MCSAGTWPVLQCVAFRGSYVRTLKRVQFQQERFNAVILVLDKFGLNEKHIALLMFKTRC